ncbi:MAG: hypothetical protein MMC33_007506 [Icmadophila ericetorum]|nr:hypothetical protein [Icmadophila ericetorum]
MADQDHDALITRFCNLTRIAPFAAKQYLATNEWDFQSAATEYYQSLEEGGAEEEEAEESDPVQPQADGGGRTLDGRTAPQPIPTTSSAATASSSSSQQPPRKKFATLGDLGGGAGHAGHGHDDNDSDDDENQDLFAGGEKSGLAVQNPDDLKRKILEKAKKNQGRPPPSEKPQPKTSRFTGAAYTLGGDDTPSRVIEDPAPRAPQRAPAVERHLHFWLDGFSVDDGPLYRSDDPANANHLAMIRQGRAPLEIMNVERNQEVDVKLIQHQEKYVQPKKKYKPFQGGGQRLGSPTPGFENMPTSSLPGAFPSEPSSAAPAAPAASSTTISSVTPTMDINDSLPTLSLQIRLGDGTRLVSRFNTTHTIGDVYEFVNVASAESRQRDWVLMTTFPSKELSEKQTALGDLSEFKRGGVVVQKWK